MQWLVYCALFCFGLCVGSFLNVLIDRLPVGKNPWKGRSKCDFCKKTIAWYDLIPLFSFISLRGRCRYCHKQLSIQYPLIELFTGIMFFFLYLYSMQLTTHNSQLTTFLSPIPSLVPLLIVFSSFLVIFVADIKYWMIPDEMVVSSLIGVVLYRIATFISVAAVGPFLISGFGATAFFAALYFGTRGRGMGFGDVKLAFVLGLFLGFPKIAVAIYLAFLTGAAVSLILILLGKKKLKQKIAFGPFLILGTIVSFFFGNQIVSWYASFLK